MKSFTGGFFLCMAFMLAGTSVIAVRFVSGSLGTFTITAVSLAFAVFGLLPICWKRLSETLKIMRVKDWVFVILQGLFGIFLFRLLLLNGLKNTSAGEAGILTGVTPAATTLMAWLILKESLNKTKIYGLICTVIGIFIIQGGFHPGNILSEKHMIGNLLVIFAALCESSFNILSRMNSLEVISGTCRKLDPTIQTTLVAGAAFIFCIPLVLRENPVNSLLNIGIQEWLALVWYGLIVTAVAFIFWYSGIKRCKASVAAAFSGMMPFTSMILSVLILGEKPGWQQWSGGLMVVAGMMFANIKETHKS